MRKFRYCGTFLNIYRKVYAIINVTNINNLEKIPHGNY